MGIAQKKNQQPPLGYCLIFIWKAIFIWIHASLHTLHRSVSEKAESWLSEVTAHATDFHAVFASGKVAQRRYFNCGLLVSLICSWGPWTIQELLPLPTKAQRWLPNGVILLNWSITMRGRGAPLQLLFSRARYYQILSPRLASSLLFSKSLYRIQDFRVQLLHGKHWQSPCAFCRGWAYCV